mgnify:CR=1 FL=1
MRFKNAFLTLMAFITALGSSVGASAEAFTIPAGATTYCKKNASPVNAWWPNNGNTTGNDSYGAAGLAVVNDKLWVLTMNGNYNDLSTYKLNILNSTTFAKEGEASLSGVDNTTRNQLFPLYDLTRMGNAVISINRPYHRYINLKIYCWESTGAPTLLFDAPLSNYLADSSTNGCNPYQGLGAIGTPGDGKIYIAAIRGETINRVIVFTIKNKKTTAVQEVTLSQDFPGKNINIEPMEDGSFWVTNFADTYGIHYNANGNKIEELSGNGIGTIYGTGQRFFTFKGRKLALNMNCSNGSTAPKLSLIDYTAGVANGKNIITDAQPTLSSNDLTPMGFTFCDYDIKEADRHLVLYGVDPDGGIVRVEYKDDRRPATVTGFTATARWEGTSQKVDLKWNAADKATSYQVYDCTNSPETKVYDGNATSKTLVLTTGTGKQHKYRIIAVNAEGTSAQSTYASTYDAGFGNIALTASIDPTDATATAHLEWSTPAYGTIKNFTVVKVIKKTPAGGTATTTTQDLATIPANTTKYDVANYSPLGSETENGVVVTVETSLMVRATMNQTITTKDGEKTNSATSNTVAPKASAAPYFTSVDTYKGRRTAALSWEVGSTTDLDHYELYRDGVKILNKYNGGSYIDTNLPDGTYSYTVVAYWKDGSVTRSSAVSASIKHADDVSSYILDTVYNYPIMTETEWNNAGKPADAVVAKGQFANAKTPVGAYGAPGDIYRQAQYYNGKWYIAQLTARTELSSGGNYIPNNWLDGKSVGTNITQAEAQALYAKWRGDWNGGIKSIGADAATIKTIGDNLHNEVTTWGLENQFVAVDEGGNMWRRAIHSGAFGWYDTPYISNEADGVKVTNSPYYRPTAFVHGNLGETAKLTYNNKSFYEWEQAFVTSDAGKATVSDFNTKYPAQKLSCDNALQYYRTHYISAGGNASNGTGFLLMSMNRTADVFRIKMNGGSFTSIDKLTAPISEVTALGRDVNTLASTENYSFPVAGRQAFIQTVRGIGTWYVDANGKYTLMFSNTADVTQCGGVTFTYNNEFFVLHPTTINSNSPGNFRIDIAQCKNGETAATVVPSKDNLMPTVANKLDESIQFDAGNSNASWYGAEYNQAENCIYIYQYVPGVRFAKYRLYIREQYPDVPPTLAITTGYNDAKTDITRFDSKITWQRPGSAHDYGLSENADITVDHYEVTLKDKNSNVIKTWNQADVKDKSHTFTISYNQNDKKEYFIDSEKYTAEIVPIYKRKDGTVIRGASNFAVDNNDYPAAIGEANAYIYQGSGSAKGAYRVDLDFNRALPAQSSEPVSYFLVEVSTDGGKNYSTLSNFNLLKQGEDYHYYPVAVTNGQVPGQYKFGTPAADSPSEKGYAMREQANLGTDHKCVLYYYSNANPSNYKYRITAVYASTNARIRKTANTTAANAIAGTSGIGDATGYVLSAYPVPATTEVTVTSPEAIRDIRLFSTSGAEVVRVAGEEGYTQSVDISTLASGVYMLVVNEQTPIRIIKK